MPTAAEENAPPAADDAEETTIPLQRRSPVNVCLVVGSILLTFWTAFGENDERLAPWLISLAPANVPARLWEVRHGEVWRLLTPAFLHFSMPHLGFNLLNLMTLGGILERRLGSRHYLLLTLGIALCSNLGQYFISGHMGFGGMSGVVYGLIGYLWLRGRTDRTFGLELPLEALIIALIWFVMCFTGWLGPIANAAHSAGLILGALWGYVDGRAATRRLPPLGNGATSPGAT